ncbi:MAG: diacylglycerol kinase family lipid kinase [Ruminococcaceae bacterium]|nr:diacylglycerol kinase family lipid kinase [Oscillospiraceae bacterium]
METLKKLLLIINPTAGKLTVKNALFDITKIFCDDGYLVTTRLTSMRGEATSFAFEAVSSKDYDLIVCCGGDGTLNETIDGVMKAGSDIPVGYIPAGSTNDFASSLGISTELSEAAEEITACEGAKPLDVGIFNKTRSFTYIASFGAFTATSYSVPQNVKNALGHFAYVLGGIKDVASIRPYHMEISSDEHKLSGDYIFGAVSNSTSIGGLIKLDRDNMSFDDGKFEVLLVKQPENAVHLHKILYGLASADFSDTEVFEFFKTEKIHFSMEEAVDWSLDGEHANGGKDVEIKNVNKAFWLMHK